MTRIEFARLRSLARRRGWIHDPQCACGQRVAVQDRERHISECRVRMADERERSG